MAVAVGFGVVLSLTAVLGFVPQLITDSKLLGIFGVNGVHNIIHLVSGIIGLVAGYNAPRSFNRWFGILYLAVFAVGMAALLGGVTLIVDLVALNMADNLLHLGAAVGLLVVGYGLGR